MIKDQKFLNLKLVFSLLLVLSCSKVFCQSADSLLVTVLKETELQKGFSTYAVCIKNVSQTPVCIMHSIFINLFYDPSQKLSLFEKAGSMEIYSLDYSMRDTLYDYEGPINNFNGEIILPLQEIKFRISLINSNLEKKLKFQFVYVNEFCYPEFENEIFKDATQWYKKYVRVQKVVELKN